MWLSARATMFPSDWEQEFLSQTSLHQQLDHYGRPTNPRGWLMFGLTHVALAAMVNLVKAGRASNNAGAPNKATVITTTTKTMVKLIWTSNNAWTPNKATGLSQTYGSCNWSTAWKVWIAQLSKPHASDRCLHWGAPTKQETLGQREWWLLGILARSKPGGQYYWGSR